MQDKTVIVNKSIEIVTKAKHWGKTTINQNENKMQIKLGSVQDLISVQHASKVQNKISVWV
jgi:hypothetical protein